MNMKLAVIAVSLAVSAAAPVAAADEAAPAGSFADAEIMAALQAADSGELQAAELAVEKAHRIDVKSFARRMSKEHSSSQAKLAGIAADQNIAGAESDFSLSLRTHAQESLAALRSLAGADFDRSYVDGMVADHQALLDALDHRMIPGAKDGKLAAFLRRKRSAVAEHLRDARRLQSRLAGGGGSNGERAVGPHDGRYP